MISYTAVCCGVRGALASHTGIRRFDSRGGDCCLLFADYKLRSINKSWKHSCLESTLISRSFQVCSVLHAPQLRKTIARPNSIYGCLAKYVCIYAYKLKYEIWCESGVSCALDPSIPIWFIWYVPDPVNL